MKKLIPYFFLLLPVSTYAANQQVFVGEWRLLGSQGGFELKANGTGRAHAPSCSGNIRWSATDRILKITYTSKLNCSIYDYQLGRQSKTMSAPAPDVIQYTLRKTSDKFTGLPVMELKGYNQTTRKKLTMVRALTRKEQPTSKMSRKQCRDKVAEETRNCDYKGGNKQECKVNVMMKYLSCM